MTDLLTHLEKMKKCWASFINLLLQLCVNDFAGQSEQISVSEVMFSSALTFLRWN